MSNVISVTSALNSTLTQSLSHWLKADDIDGGLAADFDGSLSGLGTELGSATYNMSEALLALPVFKQEGLENGYQYILSAATSPATKMNEETLTYLNQGQSYEVKMKKLGDLSDMQGKYIKSMIKVVFHERRLQYMEREQIDTWKLTRPGERILDIDVPLSRGLLDIRTPAEQLNTIEFTWDPTKDTGVYIKVHCISTEFTAKKHGGEKGVPFRIQVESYVPSESNDHKLVHCASCQIKVFKPKGADRKHKTDREKMEKRSEAEKRKYRPAFDFTHLCEEKYQPSYECTVLSEMPLDHVASPLQGTPRKSISVSDSEQSFASPSSTFPPQSPSDRSMNSPQVIDLVDNSPISSITPPSVDQYSVLSPDATAQQVTQWLQQNRFANYSRVFQNFAAHYLASIKDYWNKTPDPNLKYRCQHGADLLRLTRDDLIQICGLADGIRLNNALQSKAVRPRLTVYVCQESQQVYHAVYLENLTVVDFTHRIAQLFNISADQILEMYLQGPSGIHVLVTNEVVQNVQDHTRFAIEALPDESTSDRYRILLKSME